MDKKFPEVRSLNLLKYKNENYANIISSEVPPI